MTMWTTEAINAEIEYRRENLTRLASRTRIGRQRRSGRKEPHAAAAARRRGVERAEHATAAELAEQHRAATLPAQRTSGSHPATKQPV